MPKSEGGSLSRNGANVAFQPVSGCQPPDLTHANPASPDGGFSNLLDPAFATRADLEAWAQSMSSTAACAATMAGQSGDPGHARRIYAIAIDQAQRVMLAHLHLPHTKREEAQTA
jgi:hypothetical protein